MSKDGIYVLDMGGQGRKEDSNSDRQWIRGRQVLIQTCETGCTGSIYQADVLRCGWRQKLVFGGCGQVED